MNFNKFRIKYILKSCVKGYWNASQGLAFIDSSCLVKKTIGRVITLRKTLKPLEDSFF